MYLPDGRNHNSPFRKILALVRNFRLASYENDIWIISIKLVGKSEIP